MRGEKDTAADDEEEDEEDGDDDDDVGARIVMVFGVRS